MERGHKVIYVCVDNEAYMNTGVQRFFFDSIRSLYHYFPCRQSHPVRSNHVEERYDRDCGSPRDSVRGNGLPQLLHRPDQESSESQGANGPAYIHVLSVCATGWRIPPKKSIEYGKLAVDSGVFPLYEVENGVWKLNRKPKQLVPVADYFKGQGRYRHLDDKLIAYIQERVNEKWERLVKLSEAMGDGGKSAVEGTGE